MVRLMALFGAICISFSAIFVGMADVAPATATFFRTAYALPLLFVIWWRVRGRDRRSPPMRRLAFVSGLLLGADFTLWHFSIDSIGAGLATVLANTQVLFVGLIAWFLHGERPRPLALALVPVVFLGVVLLSGLGGADAYGSNPFAGVLFGVGAGLAYSGFLVALRRSNRVLAPASGPLLDATLGAMLGTAAVGLAGGPSLELAPVWPAHGWLLTLAVVSQVVGWLSITTALPRLPALETSIVLLAQPMGSVLWSRLIFGENLSFVQWAGVALVLAGVTLLSMRWGERRASRKVVPA
ncbi:MAG: DMT family transporter [Trueperaceae bacterium]